MSVALELASVPLNLQPHCLPRLFGHSTKRRWHNKAGTFIALPILRFLHAAHIFPISQEQQHQQVLRCLFVIFMM